MYVCIVKELAKQVEVVNTQLRENNAKESWRASSINLLRNTSLETNDLARGLIQALQNALETTSQSTVAARRDNSKIEAINATLVELSQQFSQLSQSVSALLVELSNNESQNSPVRSPSLAEELSPLELHST